MKSTQTSVQIVNFSKEHGKQGSTDSHGDAVLPKGVVGIQCSLNGYPSRHHDNQKHLKPGDEVIAHLTQVKHVYIMYHKSFKLASDSLSLCLSFSLSLLLAIDVIFTQLSMYCLTSISRIFHSNGEVTLYRSAN